MPELTMIYPAAGVAGTPNVVASLMIECPAEGSTSAAASSGMRLIGKTSRVPDRIRNSLIPGKRFRRRQSPVSENGLEGILRQVYHTLPALSTERSANQSSGSR